MKTLYWSRRPGEFVNKNTGEKISLFINKELLDIGPKFTGSVREWYETLVETIIDLRNQLQTEASKKTQDVSLYVNPDVRVILEATILYKPALGTKKSRKGLAGTLFQNIRVFESSKVNRGEIEMKLTAGSEVLYGQVNVLDLDII